MARRRRPATTLAERIGALEANAFEAEAMIIRRFGLEVEWARIANIMITGESVESSNFVTGVSGWQIDGDGNAEFQSATIRGSLNADDITAGTLSIARIASNSITMNEIELTAALVATQELRSTTYTPGSAGWQIDADGTAEFNNVTVRGTVTASDIYSTSWDGTIPLSLGTYDSGATLGFAFDGDNNNIQIMGNLFLGGNIQMINGSGALEWYNTSDVLSGELSWNQVSAFVALDLKSNSSFAIQNGDVTITDGSLTINETATYALNLKGEYLSGGFTGQWRWHTGIGAADDTELLRLYYDHNNVTGMPAELVDFEFATFDPLSGSSFKMHVNGVISVANGTASLPSMSWESDLNTGFYRIGENNIGVAGGGVEIARFLLSSGNGWIETDVIAVNNEMQFPLGGTAADPSLTFGDGDTGFYQPVDDVLEVTVLNLDRAYWQVPTANSTTNVRKAAPYVILGGALGSTAGNIQRFQSWAYTSTNQISLELQAVRDSAGSDWTTEAVGFRRITDSTAQASLWFYQSRVGVNTTAPPTTFAASGPISSVPTTTGSTNTGQWVNNSGSFYEWRRFTSSKRYKKFIKYKGITEKIAKLELPDLAEFKRKEDETDDIYFGFIAEDLAEVHPKLVSYDEQGRPETPDHMAILHVMAAKIKVLEKEVALLKAA